MNEITGDTLEISRGRNVPISLPAPPITSSGGDASQATGDGAAAGPFEISRGSDIPLYGASSASALLSKIKLAISQMAVPGSVGGSDSVNVLEDGEPVGNRYGELNHSHRLEVVRAHDARTCCHL